MTRPTGDERRIRGPMPLHAALDVYLRESGLGARALRSRVYQAWNEVVGKDLARRARPVRFVRAELSVEVESAAHFQELASFTGEDYRKRANALLRGDPIRKVKFKLKR